MIGDGKGETNLYHYLPINWFEVFVKHLQIIDLLNYKYTMKYTISEITNIQYKKTKWIS